MSNKANRVGSLEQRLAPEYESVILNCDKELMPAPEDYLQAAKAEAAGYPPIVVKSFQEGGEVRNTEVMQKLEQARKEVRQ